MSTKPPSPHRCGPGHSPYYSDKCRDGFHAIFEDGCTDDGSGCACSCHEDWHCAFCRQVTGAGLTVCTDCAGSQGGTHPGATW